MQQQEEAAHSLHPLQVGPQPLNTPEELRAIRQAMGEGKNPLVATDVPRWEDQVGVSRIINRRVLELEPLPTPAQVLAELPLTDQAQEIVMRFARACTAKTTGCWSSSAPVRFMTRRPRWTTRADWPS